jgi:flagellar motor switch protein FliN
MSPASDFCVRFIAELTRVLGALFETNVSSRSAELGSEAGFTVTIAAADGDRGALNAYFAATGAESLAEKLAASAAQPDEAAIISALKEVCGQVLAGLVERGPTAVRLEITGVAAVAEPDSSASTVVDVVMAGHEEVLRVAVGGDLDCEDSEAVDRDPSGRSRTLDVILDIDLPLIVRFGRTTMPLKALTALAPGSVVDLGRSPDEPVEVLVSNRVVAKGEVVIVAGNYGVRIRDVVSPAERARSLEGELT